MRTLPAVITGPCEKTATLRPRSLPAIAAPALVLGVATVLVRGSNANAFCWAAVQGLLVVIAAEDLRTRRIPNAITGPAVLAVILLRVAFASSELPVTLIAGIATFGVFLGIAIVARGGFGMGDVKLAGLLGMLLGASVVPALLIGTIAGAIASIVVLLRSRSRRAAFAYGPYLCVGAAVVILAWSVPHLV
jgi:leader peptidase (prepilin peptidase)/N-methyltransferase